MKPTVPKVLPLAKEIYKRDSSGCCLHIVLDDGNVHDCHVQHCANMAINNNHLDCLELAEILLKMTKTQRLKIGARL